METPTMAKPKPSEWGKINAGQPYGILALDIGRAIFGVPWGKYRAPLIYYAMEQSWGVAKTKRRGGDWPDPEPFALNLNALANLWGVPRQRLYEARDWLLSARVFLKDDDGFWINKDVHDWSDPETGYPLLSPSMLLYSARARDRSDKQPSVTPQRDTMSQSSVTPETEPGGGCHGPACHDVTPQRDTMSRSSVTSPIEEPAPVLDFKTPRLNAPASKPAPSVLDDPKLDEAHARCVETARTLFGDDKARTVGAKAMAINDMLLSRFDCYEAALREVSKRAKAGKHVKDFHLLALTIGQEYRVTGIPGTDNSIGPDPAKAGKIDYAASEDVMARIKEREASRGR